MPLWSPEERAAGFFDKGWPYTLSAKLLARGAYLEIVRAKVKESKALQGQTPKIANAAVPNSHKRSHTVTVACD